MRTFVVCFLLVSVIEAVAQNQNLVSIDSIRINLQPEPGVASNVVHFKDDLVLRVTSSLSPGTPAFYFAKCSVRAGAAYTYALNAGPNSTGKVALYITSPVGNIGWPGTIIKEGLVTQGFTAPPGATYVTLAIAFLQPQDKDSVYIKAIGLFEGSDIPANSLESKTDAMSAYLNGTIKISEAKAKEVKDNNLATFYTLSEIRIEQDLEMRIEHTRGRDFLKVTRTPTTFTPSVYFKTFHVSPGQTYTYLISLITSAHLNAYVTTPSGNLIWPGVKLQDGISKQLVNVPDGVNEITIGFGFTVPNKDEVQTALIENIGFFKGDIDPSLWNPNSGGIQPLVRPSYNYLLWFLFPTAVVALVILYFRRQKNKATS